MEEEEMAERKEDEQSQCLPRRLLLCSRRLWERGQSGREDGGRR